MENNKENAERFVLAEQGNPLITTMLVRYANKVNGDKREMLVSALRKIANPMEYLTDEAVKSGGKLDGAMAMHLINDVNWIRQFAIDVLEKYNESQDK